jgi:TATA-binding protein-associated factor
MAAAAADARAAHQLSGRPEDLPLPSLVVCPSTLVPHWGHEIAKFVEPGLLRTLLVQGPPAQRQQLQQQLAQQQQPGGAPPNVVVMSYEHLRADVDWVAAQRWLYCVLDEGHVIQNPKSKISAAARRVAARHRLLLSGTPVQNSVLELWSLFEFLMPSFLGG